MLRVAVLLGFAVLQPTVEGRIVTITNDIGRRDVHGDYLDAHDGKIVVVNGTYYLYGAFNPLGLILKLHQRALVWHLATFGVYSGIPRCSRHPTGFATAVQLLC